MTSLKMKGMRISLQHQTIESRRRADILTQVQRYHDSMDGMKQEMTEKDVGKPVLAEQRFINASGTSPFC
jgi:hypothetical protein